MIHRVPSGTFGRTLTPRTGEVDRVLQGGLPPVQYRNACGRWAAGSPKAREPFASKQIKAEVYADRRDM